MNYLVPLHAKNRKDEEIPIYYIIGIRRDDRL